MVVWLLFILAIYAPYLMWAQRTHLGWQQKDQHSIKASEYHQVAVSIIIPFRNESGVIEPLIHQLLREVPMDSNSEIILIDDHSTDDGEHRVAELLPEHDTRFKLFKSKGKGKKQALTTGINLAANSWIISLDADVELPAQWFEFITKVCANTTEDLIILPVEIYPTPRFFQKIEALEFTVLQGITFSYAQQRKAFLANGAHMAFKKQAFQDLNGYDSHAHLASGDDVFFLEQVQLSPNHSAGFSYYSDMAVATPSNPSFLHLLHQKARWASKTMAFKSKEIKRMGVLILAANLGLFALLFSGSWRIFLLGFLVKSICDLYLVLFPLTWRSRKTLSKYIPIFMVVYPFYITFVGVATLILKPKWKGRTV
ncbi:MAG: glycosyltransferase [Flavobacteriales bacterium]